MELKTIDLLNSKYFKSNGEEIYTLDKILIPSNIKIYTSTNEGYELIDDNNLTFEYLYDVKIDFIDILTHIANLESLPRIWSGVSTDDKLGKPGDIWVLAANTTS